MQFLEDFLVDTMPDWMEWTPETFIVFLMVVTMLVVMTIWDIRKPSKPTKGFLPIAFTRGERMFLFILILIGTHLVFVLLDAQISDILPSPEELVEGGPEQHWPYALPVAIVLGGIVARWG